MVIELKTKTAYKVKSSKTHTFVLTSDAVDRHNEKMDIDTFKWRENVKVYFGHETKGKIPIGKVVNIRREKNKILGDVEYYLKETEPNFSQGQVVMDAVNDGLLDSVSVGISDWETEKMDDGVTLLKNAELAEVSLVGFPANPEAIRIKALDIEAFMKEVNDKLASMQSAIDGMKSAPETKDETKDKADDGQGKNKIDEPMEEPNQDEPTDEPEEEITISQSIEEFLSEHKITMDMPIEELISIYTTTLEVRNGNND